MTDKTEKSGTKTDTTSATRKAQSRGNGGGDKFTGDPKEGLRSGVSERKSSEDTGDREAVPPSTNDRIWTNDSKERWGDDQPSLQDQLAAQRKIEADIAKKEK